MIENYEQGILDERERMLSLINKMLRTAKKERKFYVTDHGHNWVISTLEQLKKNIKQSNYE